MKHINLILNSTNNKNNLKTSLQQIPTDKLSTSFDPPSFSSRLSSNDDA